MSAPVGLYLKNLWYVAFYGGELKKGKLLPKEVLGEKVVFGRTNDNEVFALKDNCPHRGVPLSCGWFDGNRIQCCYHGWEFDRMGVCINIPALAPETNIQVNKIKAPTYPCREINGVIFIYMPDKKLSDQAVLNDLPDLLLAPDKAFKHVERVVLPCNIDHAVIGLIDPAHVTFVHQSWFWRSKKSLRIKEKHFEPEGLGFKMARHTPSSNSKGYKILKGGTSTEITFEIPGFRREHIKIGEDNEIISITTLTPLNETETELNQFFYTTLSVANMLWWPLRKLGRTFIGQDLGIFRKLKAGLENDPKLLLVGEPDAQARWYYELKKQWIKAQEENTPFVNTLKHQTLHWIT
ncbi:aromatic ring-hydroxylating dioxygenase subunit alpha [Segetibacter sp. 3557_3]|uniref:aromatic ring-hydroxylating oxygenase subunit alpha n=1 Tax=Segetibacter sp. 3557_3 TaxID=2547429 RepID=UPI0010591D9A|nr:aromatic ring-hydroxylating dioxygenase subunit alpha [Segetibacter sp. 3557_3]TDH26141.1 aromatic ring-hydroxylating dioxygenase subunit alpha [Segetibacter sp. 3557_3]